ILQCRPKPLRPGTQLGQVVAEQRPLVLRVGRSAAAAADVLHGLQKSRNPRNGVQLRAQSVDDLIRGDPALSKRLESDGDVGARAAAAEGSEAAATHRA